MNLVRSITTALFASSLMVGNHSCSEAQSAPPRTYPNITAAYLKEDARLTAPVTLQLRDVTLREALASIGSQIGFPIRVRERGGSSIERVAIFAEKTPAFKILNGIWSAFSFNEGMWQWRRSKTEDGYAYSLEQPDWAIHARQRIRDAVQRRFETGVERLISALDAGDSEKEAALLNLYGESDGNFNKYNAFEKERVWADVKAISELFSPDQRRALYQGEMSAQLKFSELSPGSQAYYLKENAKLRETEHGKRLGPPTGITVEMMKRSGVPGLMFVPGNSTTAVPALGGSPHPIRQFWEETKLAWLLPIDRRDDPVEQVEMDYNVRPIPPPPTPPGAFGPRYTESYQLETLLSRFEAISTVTERPVVIRIPQDRWSAGIVFNKPIKLADKWKDLWNNDFMWKWHDGVLLATNRSWPLEDPPVKPEIVEEFNKSVVVGKHIPLRALATLCSQLTLDQTYRLAKRLPVSPDLPQHRRWIGALIGQPDLGLQMWSASGLTITRQNLAAVKEIVPRDGWSLLSDGRAHRLVVSERWFGPDTFRQAYLSVYDDQSRLLRQWTYTHRPVPDPKAKSPTVEMGTTLTTKKRP